MKPIAKESACSPDRPRLQQQQTRRRILEAVSATIDPGLGPEATQGFHAIPQPIQRLQTPALAVCRPLKVDVHRGVCDNHVLQELHDEIQHAHRVSTSTVQLLLIRRIMREEVLL